MALRAVDADDHGALGRVRLHVRAAAEADGFAVVHVEHDELGVAEDPLVKLVEQEERAERVEVFAQQLVGREHQIRVGVADVSATDLIVDAAAQPVKMMM